MGIRVASVSGVRHGLEEEAAQACSCWSVAQIMASSSSLLVCHGQCCQQAQSALFVPNPSDRHPGSLRLVIHCFPVRLLMDFDLRPPV